MKRAALITLSFVGVVLAAASFAAADPASNTFVPSNGTFFDFCTGETIGLNGVNHFVTTSTTTPGGGVHSVVHMNALDFHGVGLTSGTQYVAGGTNNSAVTFDLPVGATTTEVSVHLRLIAQGQAEDIILDSLYHVTVNANGDVTADVNSFQVFCHV